MPAKYEFNKRQEISNKYLSMPARKVGKEFGISESTVRKYAKEFGVNKKEALVECNKMTYRMLVDDLKEGHSFNDVAEMREATVGKVRYAAKKLGFNKTKHDEYMRDAPVKRAELAREESYKEFGEQIAREEAVAKMAREKRTTTRISLKDVYQDNWEGSDNPQTQRLYLDDSTHRDITPGFGEKSKKKRKLGYVAAAAAGVAVAAGLGLTAFLTSGCTKAEAMESRPAAKISEYRGKTIELVQVQKTELGEDHLYDADNDGKADVVKHVPPIAGLETEEFAGGYDFEKGESESKKVKPVPNGVNPKRPTEPEGRVIASSHGIDGTVMVKYENGYLDIIRPTPTKTEYVVASTAPTAGLERKAKSETPVKTAQTDLEKIAEEQIETFLEKHAQVKKPETPVQKVKAAVNKIYRALAKVGTTGYTVSRKDKNREKASRKAKITSNYLNKKVPVEDLFDMDTDMDLRISEKELKTYAAEKRAAKKAAKKSRYLTSDEVIARAAKEAKSDMAKGAPKVDPKTIKTAKTESPLIKRSNIRKVGKDELAYIEHVQDRSPVLNDDSTVTLDEETFAHMGNRFVTVGEELGDFSRMGYGDGKTEKRFNSMGNRFKNFGNNLVHFVSLGSAGEPDVTKRKGANGEDQNKFLTWLGSPFRMVFKDTLGLAKDIVDVPTAGAADKVLGFAGTTVKETVGLAGDIVDTAVGAVSLPIQAAERTMWEEPVLTKGLNTLVGTGTRLARNTVTFEAQNNGRFDAEGRDKGVIGPTIEQILGYWMLYDKYEDMNKKEKKPRQQQQQPRQTSHGGGPSPRPGPNPNPNPDPGYNPGNTSGGVPQAVPPADPNVAAPVPDPTPVVPPTEPAPYVPPEIPPVAMINDLDVLNPQESNNIFNNELKKAFGKKGYAWQVA